MPPIPVKGTGVQHLTECILNRGYNTQLNNLGRINRNSNLYETPSTYNFIITRSSKEISFPNSPYTIGIALQLRPLFQPCESSPMNATCLRR